MAQTTQVTRQNRTLTVDFQDPSTYFQLISDGKAFVEFVLAFLLSLGEGVSHVLDLSDPTLTAASTFEPVRKKRPD